jgi:hypothetical protein
LAALWTSTAAAQAVPGQPLDSRLTFSAGLDGTFGAASLLADTPYTQTDYFLMSADLSANYQLTDEISLSAGTGWSKYLSQGGGANEQYESRLQDTSLSFSIFPIVSDETYTGIIVTGGLSLRLPTSVFSQAEGLYTSISPSLTFIKPFGGAILVYSLGYNQNFHEYTSQTASASEFDLIARDGGVENLGADLVALDGVLPQFSIRNNFALLFNFAQVLQARVGFGFNDAWTYDNGTITQQDEFTSPYAVAGRGHRQNQSSSLGLRWLVTGDSFFGRAVVASATMSNAASPLTDDNRGLRFPFWDFESPQATRTAFSFSVSGTY